MGYRCVDAQKAAGFPVAAACQAAGVIRSACYAWTAGATQGASERQREEARLVGEIRPIHARSGGTYGAHGSPPSCAGAAGAPTPSGWSGGCAPMASSASAPSAPQLDQAWCRRGARAGAARAAVRP
jgi:hypothetical protein